MREVLLGTEACEVAVICGTEAGKEAEPCSPGFEADVSVTGVQTGTDSGAELELGSADSLSVESPCPGTESGTESEDGSAVSKTQNRSEVTKMKI